jgi:serine/threonine protein kinase
MGVNELHKLGYIHRDLKPEVCLFQTQSPLPGTEHSLALAAELLGRRFRPRQAYRLRFGYRCLESSKDRIDEAQGRRLVSFLVKRFLTSLFRIRPSSAGSSKGREPRNSKYLGKANHLQEYPNGRTALCESFAGRLTRAKEVDPAFPSSGRFCCRISGLVSENAEAATGVASNRVCVSQYAARGLARQNVYLLCGLLVIGMHSIRVPLRE